MRIVIVVALVASCGRVGFDSVGGDGSQLVVTPPAATINLGSKVMLEVSGGVAPYTLAITGDGTLLDQVFVAPSKPGESIITVTDVGGRTGNSTITYRGDRLFVVGGDVASTPSSTVLSSDDGVTWTEVGNLPAARSNGALVVFDDRMFYFGGLNQTQAATTTVFSSVDGVTWSMAGNLPVANTGFPATVHRGEIWISGGATSAGNSGQAFHSSDGVDWTAAPATFAGPRHEHDAISRDGRLYVIGGHGDSGILADVVSTVDGTSWTDHGQVLTFATDFGAAARFGDRVVRTCGDSCTSSESSLDLVTWTQGGALDVGRTSPALVELGGRLLLIGGGLETLATTDGSSWAAIGSLPALRTRTAAVQFTPR